MPLRCDPRVRLRELVAVLAVRLGRALTPTVLGWGHRFKVRRLDAPPIPAQMVDLVTERYRPDVFLIRDAVSEQILLPLPIPHPTVTSLCESALGPLARLPSHDPNLAWEVTY